MEEVDRQMIPFVDLKRQIAPLRSEIDEAFRRVLDSGMYVLGPQVEAFENELAAFLGCAYCVGVANGTEAIAIALMACGIGAGDQVITADITAYPTVTGICMSGADPVVADIDPATGLLDPGGVESRITSATKALLPVHLYGQSCDLTRLLDIARRHDLLVVEDCAQAIGARWLGRRVGTIGDVGCFSFYPTKNLGALGDAGAVTTDSDEIARQARVLRNCGQTDRYHHVAPGLNSRLSELQASLLRVKLSRIEAWNERRRQIAGVYRAGLRGVDTLHTPEGSDSVWHLFPVRAGSRDAFRAAMLERGVQTLVHYPRAVSRQPTFPGTRPAASPRSDDFATEVVSLPIYPELTDWEVDHVVAAANESTLICPAAGM
jgi:dTDP-4-amino-4,6-dideoxygalactose transaminase